ncbi:MAG: type II toxin-antitoxin system RelE/ParE family toxin [Spirochaetales bacterium]|nr:type II toxin-antitoxin system RelE/ParE family toxin [Spirochaetales bacterium]
MYKLKYLPLAVNDLHELIAYISDILKAPQPAMKLLDNFDSSISRLKEFPYSCRIYQTEKLLETEYRVLSVKNYLVFYVVIEHTVEIHRIIYGGMDYGKLYEE